MYASSVWRGDGLKIGDQFKARKVIHNRNTQSFKVMPGLVKMFNSIFSGI